MSKFAKGSLLVLVLVLLVGTFVGIGFVSNWFSLPTSEWGNRWNEIWGAMKGSPDTPETPVELALLYFRSVF